MRGGVLILVVERWHRQTREARLVTSVDDIRSSTALALGFAQALALIPGTSRSGATIIGGLALGLTRKTATEFSFFLAIPTLLAAGSYDLLKHSDVLSWQDLPMFAVGCITSFISAFACIRWLLRYVSQHDFAVFAWYRIVFGIGVLVALYLGSNVGFA